MPEPGTFIIMLLGIVFFGLRKVMPKENASRFF
ncbi:PEP-CTERM sorting domain-containing protein [Candidatus Uabimicrobium amorphum]